MVFRNAAFPRCLRVIEKVLGKTDVLECGRQTISETCLVEKEYGVSRTGHFSLVDGTTGDWFKDIRVEVFLEGLCTRGCV